LKASLDGLGVGGVVEVIFGFLGFLWIFLGFFRNFLKIIGGSWRSLKNFAMLSGGWKEGMVWLQKVLENENGLSGFFVWISWNFLKIFGEFWIFVWILGGLEGFCSKIRFAGRIGDRPFQGQRLLLPDAEHARTNI